MPRPPSGTVRGWPVSPEPEEGCVVAAAVRVGENVDAVGRLVDRAGEAADSSAGSVSHAPGGLGAAAEGGISGGAQQPPGPGQGAAVDCPGLGGPGGG